MRRLALAAVGAIVLCLSQNAAAQGFVSPFVGTTLTTPSPQGSKSKAGFGVSFGSLGRFVGFDTEVAYFPEILDNSSNGLAKSRAVLLSADTLIGPTIGRVKAYGAFGFGDLHLNVTSLTSVVVPVPTAATISNDYFAFNVGGGVMGFFAEHVGVRGDLRYYRAFGFKITDLQTAGLALDKFDFWRASAGVAFKF